MDPSRTRGPVLLIDDDPAYRYTVSRWLQQGGYEVVTAASGTEALEHLRKAEVLPRLILLDILMPEMDGNAFRWEQLGDPRLQGIPVVVLTMLGAYDPRALGGYFRAYCPKSVDRETLLQLVAQHCH
ncbi:MAG: response regulator [Armatimonadota bacterium]